MSNCKPTIVINNVEYASEKGIDSSSSLEAIVQALILDPVSFASIKEALNSPITDTANISSFNDLVHIIPANSSLTDVNEFLMTTGRTYLPVILSIEAAINTINKFGNPKILWIDGDIQVNGASVSSYLLGNISDDLIILKSHKLEDINNTLQEYIYGVVLGNEGGELLDVIRSRYKNSSNKKVSNIVNNLSASNIFSKLLYDDEFNKLIDTPRSATDKKRTLRQELQEHILDMLLNKDKVLPRYFKVTRIISGGQTGVDMLGVQIANKLGYETGGTLPPKMKQETHEITVNGVTLKVYGLTQEEAQEFGFQEIDPLILSLHERSDSDWVPRTEENAKNSDGTVYFPNSEYFDGKPSGGLIATKRGADKFKKPFKVIDWRDPGKAVQELQQWLIDNNIRTLNIAGSRGSNLSDSDIENISKVIDAVLDTRKWLERSTKEIINPLSNPYTRTSYPSELTKEQKDSALPISMVMDYGNNSRDGLKSKSTFEAILRGERSSTTRYYDFKLNNPSNPIIAIYKNKEDILGSKEGKNIIYAQVLGVNYITLDMARDLKAGLPVTINIDGQNVDFVSAWTSAEGWSEKHLRENVASKILESGKPASWIRYRLLTADIPNPPKFGNKATTFTIKGTDIVFDGSLKSLTDALLAKKGIKTMSKNQKQEIKKQVGIVFDRMPELKRAVEEAGGTIDEYLDYLLLIYPESVEKSIYWHGSDSDFSGGFNTAQRGKGSGAPEIQGDEDFYVAKLPWTVLLYVSGVNRTGSDVNGFGHWNKLWWELKEIMSNGRRENDDWKKLVIGDDPNSVREQIPNKRGLFDENHGKLLETRKADYGYLGKSNKEFFEEVFGIRWGIDTFDSWVLKNAEKFRTLERTPNEKLPGRTSNTGGIYPVIINTTNPYREKGQNTYYEEQRGVMTLVQLLGNDAILGEKTDNEFGSDVAVIINNHSNIHFLGTPSDILAFKVWKESNKNDTVEKQAEGLAERILTGRDSLGNALPDPQKDLLKQIDTFIGCN